MASNNDTITKQLSDYLLQAHRLVFFDCDEDYTSMNINKSGLVQAISENVNVSHLGYKLSEDSLLLLARMYSNNFSESLYEYVAARVDIPYTKPFYPDFPKQVLEMNELTYRVHQLTHYFSTYGVEAISDILGCSVSVKKGYLPDVEETIKINEDKRILDAKVIDICISLEELVRTCYKKILYKNARMSPSDMDLIAALPVINFTDLDSDKILFRENAELFIDTIVSAPSDYVTKAALLSTICKHPTDIAKYITRSQHKFTTSAKRTLVTVLESFPKGVLLENVADNQHLFKVATSRISYNRFARDVHAKHVINELRNNRLTSWNSKKEKAYENGDAKAILNILGARPGILVRELRRLIRCGVAADYIKEVLNGKVTSQMTLLNIVNNARAFSNLSDDEQDVLKDILVTQIRRNIPVVKELQNKVVAFNDNNINTSKSIIISNTNLEVSNYLEPGLAFNLPEDANVVRFFIYWNNPDKRLDIDLHSLAFTNDDERIHIGWDNDYNSHGVTMSGDITHSDHACEYIDVRVTKENEDDELERLTKFVNTMAHCYNFKEFADCDTVYCGIEVVNDTNTNVKLYNPKNVIFKVDLSDTNARALSLARINVEDRYLKFSMQPQSIYSWDSFDSQVNGEVLNYTVENYINDLCAKNNVTITDNADLELSITKSDGISLLDNNWFI